MEEEIREQFKIEIGKVNDLADGAQGNGYEIITISAGMGNGWEFSADVLRESLMLWDGVECFIDHAPLTEHNALSGRSIRDIAGVIGEPVWDEGDQAIKARLAPMGPSAGLLKTVGQELVENSQGKMKIGFSADLIFSGKNKKVGKIIKVNSVDLVYNPARGGKFVRSLNQSEEEKGTEKVLNSREFSTPRNELGPSRDAAGSSYRSETTDMENKDKEEQELQKTELQSKAVDMETKDEKGESKTIENELEEARIMKAKLSQWTMEMGLEKSKLPKPMQEMIKKQFEKQAFSIEALDEAVEAQRTLLSQLTGSSTVRSPGRVEGMLTEDDRLRLAVEDLFGLEREPGQNTKVPALSGIRELYLTLTGDTDLHGGYYPERIQLATTADFSGLVKNALNKIVVKTWNQLGKAGYDWWKNVCTVEHFNTLQSITGTLIGTVGDLPAISEGAEYTQLPVGDSPETASFTKYGGYIPLTLELIDRDDAKRLGAYARNLGIAGLRKVSKLVSEIFTANAGIGPTMADGGALFNATAVTTAGGHKNLLTTALSANEWDAVSVKIYQQPMLLKNEAGMYGTGPSLAINPKFMLIPRSLAKAAMEICAGNFVREEGFVFDNVLKGTAVPVVVPEWTDNNNWAAACDPTIAPAVYVGERFGIMPEVFVAGENTSPAVFMNDEHRLKVRHFLAVWVNDFRPLHKSNVA